ncbi:MAG: hypothetical protein JWN80_1066 [Microbacteriaceae bacterium]|nr:hypothetical protein [Microbacteriaceae bacterium]
MDRERHVDEEIENDIPEPDLLEDTRPIPDEDRTIEDDEVDEFEPEDPKDFGGQAE